jgi:hypothetical protein
VSADAPDDESPSPPELLLRARSPAEAQVVAALLRAAGIPFYIEGRLLQDEFALSQALMGLTRARVEVPADRLQEARALLEQARRDGTTDPDRGGPG